MINLLYIILIAMLAAIVIPFVLTLAVGKVRLAASLLRLWCLWRQQFWRFKEGAKIAKKMFLISRLEWSFELQEDEESGYSKEVGDCGL